MEVTSSTTTPAETGKDPIQKAIQVQEQAVLKVLEGLEEQSRAVTAQKTGVGQNINITG